MRFLGALVGLLIAVSVLGVGQSLSGSWQASADFDPTGVDWISLSSSLSVDYIVGVWTFSSSSIFGKTGWSAQTFKAAGALGDLALSSSLDLDPSAVSFKKWSNLASWNFDSVSLSASFDVAANYVASSFSACGQAGDLSFSLDMDFRSRGGCELLFDCLDVSIDFPFCCARSLRKRPSCAGFEEAAFSVSDIEIPNLVWMTLDADLTFEMEEKLLDFSPSFDFGDFSCFKLYIDVETTGNVSIDSIEVYGIGLTCDIGDVSFEALSYLDGTHKLNGKYWEMYSLSLDREADCCGLTSAELAVYFLEGGAKLFDVGLLEGKFSLALSETSTFDMGMTFDIEAGVFEELTLGFEVSW